MKAIKALLFTITLTSTAHAEKLCPKYGKCVPINQFSCYDIDRSSLVSRVCYNEPNSYLIIRLKATDYHYCAVDAATVDEFLAAESMGRFYNHRIKIGGTDGRFDCRIHPAPTF